jgi:hypothetical protein
MATAPGVLCVAARPGCMDSSAANYDLAFNIHNGLCLFNGCTDSTKLGYTPMANLDLPAGTPGACIEPRTGCTDASSYNFDSRANVDDGSCVPWPPSPPPPSPPFLDALVLGLTTSYTIAELDYADLSVSVGAFVATVPETEPDWSTFAGESSGVGRRLDDTWRRRRRRQQQQQQQPAGAPAPTRRGLQSIAVASGVLESLADWVSDADWRVEYARRLARTYWLPKEAVTFASGIEQAGSTVMTFNVATVFMPPGANGENLKNYAASLPSSAYSEMLAVPVLSVGAILASELKPPPSPPAPAEPPETTTPTGEPVPAGVIVGIVLPVLVLWGLAMGAYYWHRTRRTNRLKMATVLPEQQASASVLVQPPDIPLDDDDDEDDEPFTDGGLEPPDIPLEEDTPEPDPGVIPKSSQRVRIEF